MYRIKYFFSNLVWWWSFLWNDRQWDSVFLYGMMARKLQRMYNFHANARYGTLTDKQLRKLYTAYIICERLALEDYVPFVNGELLYPKTFPVDYKNYLQKQDLELLGKILKSQSLNWWD